MNPAEQAAADRIEWHRGVANVDDHERSRVSLRKPLRPMSYERLMEICAEGRARNGAAAAEFGDAGIPWTTP